MARRLARLAATGWIPTALLVSATAAVLVRSGTSPRDVAAFATAVVVVVAVPGMLWVRWLHGRSEHVADDLAMGLAFGYCVVVGVYLLGRAIGLPLLVLAWPLATVVAFAVLRPLRRFWRSDAPAAPTWWSWSLVAILGVVLLHSARTFFDPHPLVGSHAAYVDMPYHLALVAELRHHVPPVIPYVLDTPLAYHWFVYAEAAATSWITGAEPLTLLYRLSGVPMFAAVVVLTSTAARLVAGRAAAPLAVAIALFISAASPYPWAPHPVFDAQTLVPTWISPTNLFGLVLITAAIVALITVLRGETPAAGRSWMLVGILVLGASGAKSTLLPLLGAGLVALLVLHAVTQRRIHRAGLVALGIVGAAFAVAFLFVYQGAGGGLAIGLDSLRSFAVAAPAQPIPRLSVLAPALALGVALVLWSFMWAGAFGLLARGRRALEDPAIGLLAGICLASLGAVALLAFPGLSQLYFTRAAAPAFGILTAAGILAIAPSRFRPLLHGAIVALTLAAGATTILIVGAAAPTLPPEDALGLRSFTFSVLAPIAGLVLVSMLLVGLLALGGRRWRSARELTPIVLITFVMGFSLPNVIGVVTSPAVSRSSAVATIPWDGTAAARWLRAHSDPGDLVATNMHCRGTVRNGVCDARHFWVSGFAERRILVEGWAYTQRAIDIGRATGANPRRVPFWEPELLALNDAAFSVPSADVLSTLRAQHGVRWLFASLPQTDVASLDRLATLRHRVGDYAVYELGPATSSGAGPATSP